MHLLAATPGTVDEGLFTLYRLADKDVLRLCDLMCGRIETEAKTRGRLFPA
jgi:hypothetical protein